MKIMLTISNEAASSVAVTMESVVANTNSEQQFLLLYYQDSLDEDIRQQFIAHYANKHARVSFLPVDSFIRGYFEHFFGIDNPEIFHALWLVAPEIIVEDLKLLYLAPNLIIQRDIEKALNGPLIDTPLAAIRREDGRFCSEMLWIDLKQCREKNLASLALHYARSHQNEPGCCHDIVNGVFTPYTAPLESIWQMKQPFYAPRQGTAFAHSSDEQEALRAAAVIALGCPHTKPMTINEKLIYSRYKFNSPWPY